MLRLLPVPCSRCGSGGPREQPVVERVVDAAQRQRRTELVALAGVVVDDVEDHLEPGPVQGPDHRLELAHLLAEAAGGVADVRGKKAIEL